MANEQNYLSYAINPYAVGEGVAGESIDWNSMDHPQKTLSEILNVREGDLFADNSPFILPDIQVQNNGSVKFLSKTATNEKIQSFVSQKRIVAKPPVKGLRLASVQKRIPEIMLANSESKESSSNVPWKPAHYIWADVGDYFDDVVKVTDPRQGALGDCYFIAALASVAWAKPYIIVNATKPSASDNEGSPFHRVAFYQNKKQETVEVSERIPLYETTDSVIYASSANQREIWPAIMEKAYVKWRTGNKTDYPNYPFIAGGYAPNACAELIGGTAYSKIHSSVSENALMQFIKSNCDSYCTINPMVAGTYGSSPSGCNYSKAGIVQSHAYSILGYEKYRNDYYVILRNPWGSHHGTLDTRAGAWEVYNNSAYMKVQLNQDGIFSMKVGTYKKYFRYTGVAV